MNVTKALVLMFAVFTSIGVISMSANTIEPNGRARLLVKRDLRLFALDYEPLMELVQKHRVLVDLMMIAAPTPGQDADLGFNKAHLWDAGRTLRQVLDEIKARYGDVVIPDHVIEVFKSNEITLFRLSKASPEVLSYVLQPGDIVMVRTVSDI